ncbi:hypothetical protein DOK78_002802 [Enterococcus sp. DIV2402]|jgi:hypothetical protein|uniref:Tetratricopeptide repeat protein n=1 Tax=Candidatus Enterococcus lowellii TaxID=2230877 RepID=A0ABZ2SSJ2_9ENTE|nr:tetratricopeptide repeat protein [Enterococcus sp. DIV2402]MBO0464948.1 tetratricopeptide repeat protein [Enterococcus sp. DIV2402]
MFGFFKKKTKEKQPEQPVLSEERRIELLAFVSKKEHEMKQLTSDEQLAKLYEEIGLAYAELEDEQAIPTLEKSLEYKLTMGDGYKKLMSLYNAKRAEAARNGDDTGIEKYMNKMDDMRQIAKKLTITGGK